ncbi:MAG TPA: hypothetical protein VML75_19935 [Kofleriaceae bacterium]|nr:hypothetical protein [Kofleriaceae bacterium]
MRGLGLCTVAVLVGLMGTAEAQKKKAPAGDAADISAIKAELVVLSDGQGHFLVAQPKASGALYYGDGKRFFEQRVFSSGSDGRGNLSMRFWDPRSRPSGADIDKKDNVWRVTCDKRETVFSELPAKETARILDNARFFKALWKYQAYALSRDDRGTYYYVDRLRDEFGGKGFRLWVGPRGAMVPQQMTNIVSDSEGDIFATKKGDLRLILDKKDARWVKGKKKTELTHVPIWDNAYVIYAELGVYVERMGTPCDDL